MISSHSMRRHLGRVISDPGLRFLAVFVIALAALCSMFQSVIRPSAEPLIGRNLVVLLDAILLALLAGSFVSLFFRYSLRHLGEFREALAASEARVRELSAMSGDWYWETDRELRITWLTGGPAASELLGVQPVYGTRIDALPGVRVFEPGLARWREQLLSRESFDRIRVCRLSPAGGPVHHVLSGRPAIGPDGEYSGYRGLGRRLEEVPAVSPAREPRITRTVASMNPGDAIAPDLAHVVPVPEHHRARSAPPVSPLPDPEHELRIAMTAMVRAAQKTNTACLFVLVGVRERGETDAGPGALAAVDRIARVRQCLGGVLRRGDRLLAGTRGEMAVLLPDSGSRAASEAFVQRIRDYLSDALAPPFGPTRSSASPAIEVCIDALSTARFPEDADSAATLLSIARRDLALQRAAGEGDPVQAFPGRITRSVALEETHSSDANST